jgi:hypothetical protein
MKHSLHPSGASHPSAALVLLGCVAFTIAPARAQVTCESLSAQIEARIRAAGVTSFSLRTLDLAEAAPGKVVGSCDRGAKKIVYLQTAAGSAAAAAGPTRPAPRTTPRRVDDGILTECKDGSMSVGGDCGRR